MRVKPSLRSSREGAGDALPYSSGFTSGLWPARCELLTLSTSRTAAAQTNSFELITGASFGRATMCRMVMAPLYVLFLDEYLADRPKEDSLQG